MQSFRMFSNFLAELLSRRNVIYELTKRDFKSVYLGSYLGIVWAFLLPVVNILIFWFVFQVGFKAQPVDNYPYILWLIPGMTFFFFFSDCVNNGTSSIVQNAFVVKKVVFSIGILPIIKILSGLVIHLFFVLLIFLMFLAYGHYPDIYTLQFVYYLFAMVVFVLGLTWLTSSVVIFFKDLRQIITMLLQIGFYLTPVFWNPHIIPEEYHIYLMLNPVYYLVQGYRDSFIHKVWFWEHPVYTLYFWCLTGVVFVGGAVVFRRLRPHFADVL